MAGAASGSKPAAAFSSVRRFIDCPRDIAMHTRVHRTLAAGQKLDKRRFTPIRRVASQARCSHLQ